MFAAQSKTNEPPRDPRESAQLHEESGVFPVQTPIDQRTARELPLHELLREDFATYDRKLTEPGLWAILAHRLGSRANHASSRTGRALLDGASRVLSTAVNVTWGIDLPKQVEVGRRVRIWHFGCMRLEARSIGNDVHIRHDTTFGPLQMRAADPTQLPVIEDRADLGVGVCVLGDVRVGHDTLVGANSLVMKDVPSSSIALGVPARILPR